MKKLLTIFLGISLFAICLTACGWSPKVEAVPLTAPWAAMNLPIQSNAVVWKSEANEFRAVHKEDRRTILKNYTEALKGQGWELGDFKEEGDRFLVDMTKEGEPLLLEVYDFDNTGVAIKTGAAINDNPYSPSNTKTSNDAATKTGNSIIGNVDFTFTSEQFDKEFTTKGAKKEDLEKYANKNIAVTGRVSLLSMEKQGTVQPWVTLYAPGTLKGVNCYFDDGNLDQMKRLKMDKAVKVRGVQDDFIVPEISPSLRHCIVLEAS